MTDAAARHRRWISYAACGWAILFAAPHIWWALGIPAGFPGGEANHQLMMTSAWRYISDLVVIILSALAVLIALTLLRPPHQVARRWVPYAAAWIASGMLTLRGVGGLVVDGASDPIWWPTFLLGGLLLGSVAWLARVPSRSWLQGLPWLLHRRAHWGYWLIAGAATVLGLLVWSGRMSLSDAEDRFLLWVAIAFTFYFVSLGWYALRNTSGRRK